MTRSALVPMLASVLALTAAGCATAPPPTLYVLSPVAPAPERSVAPAPGKQRVVALGPVTVPDYLDRTDMVRRATADRLEVSESERWAETLRAGLQRVLAADLANRLGPGFWVGGARSGQADVEVPVDVEAFERDPEGRMVLTASWDIRPVGAERAARHMRKTWTRMPADAGTGAQVRALSANVDDLAADIAAGLGK